MRFVLILVGFVLSLAACATSVPMADATTDARGKSFEQPAAGMAALYIIHTDSFMDAPAINVSIGQRALGGLTNKTWFRVDLEPGLHDVRATGRDGSGSLLVKLQPGEIKFVTATYAHYTLTGIVTEMPLEKGKQLVLSGRRAQEIR